MSYEIEHGKRVLSLKTQDKRLRGVYDETLVYVVAWASNNVHPRHFDWHVIAIDSFSQWNGEFMLPTKIWELGEAADGGSIKPWDKNVTGIGYVRSWKRAVAERTPIDGWTPHVTAYVHGYGEVAKQSLQKIRDGGVGCFGDGNTCDDWRWEAFDAYRRLFPSGLKHDSTTVDVSTEAQLLDAMYLYKSKSLLPFAFYIEDREHSAFMKREAKPKFAQEYVEA